MMYIENESDVKELIQIFEEFTRKEYQDKDWSFFNERISSFSMIMNKYSIKTSRLLDISNQKLILTNRDMGYTESADIQSIGYLSAKQIMKEIIESLPQVPKKA